MFRLVEVNAVTVVRSFNGVVHWQVVVQEVVLHPVLLHRANLSVFKATVDFVTFAVYKTKSICLDHPVAFAIDSCCSP